MQFSWQRKEITWKGLSCISDDLMTSGQLKRLASETCEVYLCYLEGEVPNCDNTPLFQKCLEIHNIISKFSDIFADPSGHLFTRRIAIDFAFSLRRDIFIFLKANNKSISTVGFF